MTKNTTPNHPGQPTGLAYHGKNGNPYIMCIPARDLSLHELISLAIEQKKSMEEFIELLCSRKNTAGEPLYSRSHDHQCSVCGKPYTTWNGLHRHTLKEHTPETVPPVEEEMPQPEPEPIDDNIPLGGNI